MAFVNYRSKVVIALCLMVGLGILSRVMPIGFRLWDKYLGDAIYAAVFYLAISLVWPTGALTKKGALTTVYVVAIELFQLTLIPDQLNQSDNLAVKLFAYVVLGSMFSWWDLVAYGIGIVGVVCLDERVLKVSADQ